MNLYHDTRTYTPDESTTSFGRLPDGKYKAMITQVEEKIAQSTGKPYVSLTIEITDGAHRGRKVWDILSLNSDNPDAVSLAKRKLNEIAMAIGKTVIQGADCFKYKEIGVYLTKDRQKDDKNQVKQYIKPSDVGSSYNGAGNMGSTAAPKVDNTNEDEIPF